MTENEYVEVRMTGQECEAVLAAMRYFEKVKPKKLYWPGDDKLFAMVREKLEKVTEE